MFKRILVIKLRHIGDVLLSTAVFRTLKENFPNSRVAALVNKYSEAVLEQNPYIDEIISYDRHIKELKLLKRYLKDLKFLMHLRRNKFDTILDLTGGDRAAILSKLSGAKNRIGIKSKGFFGKSLLYTRLIKTDINKHTLLSNLEVLQYLGLKVKKPKVDLFVSSEEIKWARNLILNDKSQISKRFVHIHPTSRWLFKCWRDDYMAEVILWFLKNNFDVILTSDSTEKEMNKIKSIKSFVKIKIDKLRGKFSSQIIDLSGKLNLRQLIAVTCLSDLFFGVDTAPMHIAAALGKPVVALFGPTGAFNWGPWDNDAEEEPYIKRRGIQRFGRHTVIQREWECIPCGKDGCKGSKISNCLFDIKPEEVIEIIKDITEKIQK